MEDLINEHKAELEESSPNKVNELHGKQFALWLQERFESKCIPSTLKRSVVADVSGKSWLGEVQTSSGMFIHKNMVGDRGLSTVREHTVVSGGVHGPGKAVLKRPGLQKSSTSHRGSLTQTQATPVAASDVPSTFSSKPVASEKASLGGKASLQPKRTLMTQEEINAIMSSDVSMKNKGHNKMDYSRPGPGKGILKRSGLQNSSTNHRSQPTHKTDGSLRLRDEDSPVRERAKPFSHNPSFQRSGSKKRKRNGDLEDHLEVNSPLIDRHTNDLEVNSPLTDIHTNDLQSEEHIGSTSNGTTVTRKETRALSAAKRSRLNNRKLVFEVDQCAGRIVGDDSQVFITKGGCLVRERAKFDGTTWRKQEPSLKTDIIAKCVENSSFNGNCKSMLHAIDTQLASQHKSRRWRLHNHYKTYPTKEQAVMNPPKGVKVPDWVLLCERFASEDFQKISTRNKLNRSKNEIPPANGTKSMAREIHMRTKQGKTVTAIGGFKICHFSEKKKAMVNDKAAKLLLDLENEEANSSSTPAEICIQKLGYIPGHLKGRSASKRNILANESLQRELQLEKEKTKKLQIHINKMEKKHNKMEKQHNNLKKKVDYLMKYLPQLSEWQSQGQENEENDGSDDDDDGDDGRENEENEEYEESDDDNDGQENEENAGSDDDDVGSDDDGQENEENVGSDDDGQEHQDFI